MPSNKRGLLAASQTNSAEPLYVEDVFSTYLYTGNGVSQSLANGIDFSGEGGLFWLKGRNGSGGGFNHFLIDTERGADKWLFSNDTNSEGNVTFSASSFNSDGFSFTDNYTGTNNPGDDYVSWSFRKAPGFFDVVTYTGNSTGGRTISHNLGCVPGCIIVKSLSATGTWEVYHNGLDATSPEDKSIQLQSTGGVNDSNLYWNDTAPTATEFTLGGGSATNFSGREYVAYLFAHDDQSFGAGSDESIIKCGSYTGAGGLTDVEVSLGWEPQYILRKRTDSIGGWYINDVMRGLVTTTSNGEKYLFANSNIAEAIGSQVVGVNPDGFTVRDNLGDAYIYIAIRRPMKTPDSASEVFAIDSGAQTTSGIPWFESGFVTDFAWVSQLTTHNPLVGARLMGTKTLDFTNTGAEVDQSNQNWDYMTGYYDPNATTSYYAWMFKRAPGFMDVVCYEGTGVAHAENHGLTVTPELIICKRRNATNDWAVYHKDLTSSDYNLVLSSAAAEAFVSGIIWGGSHSSTGFDIDTDGSVNISGAPYIAILFATLDGISKVGSYTGTGSDVTVDCGFTNGAAFVLVKRTDSTGDWYLWDSTRGIVAGNDPYLLLNSAAAEVTNTDYIDPDSSGFVITSSAPAALNASGGEYIFLAIAST